MVFLPAWVIQSWTFYIDAEGKVSKIDKDVNPHRGSRFVKKSRGARSANVVSDVAPRGAIFKKQK